MNLVELEQIFNIKLPSVMKEIETKGGFNWLHYSSDWICENREKIQKEEAFFYLVGGDCEPISFIQLTEKKKELEEMLEFDIKCSEDNICINPDYVMIPFGQMASGDLFCFVYDSTDREEPRIVVYGHDTGDIDLWADNFNEFMFIQLAETINEDPEVRNSHVMDYHIQFLTEDYGNKLRTYTTKELCDEIEKLKFPQPFNIFKDI